MSTIPRPQARGELFADLEAGISRGTGPVFPSQNKSSSAPINNTQKQQQPAPAPQPAVITNPTLQPQQETFFQGSQQKISDLQQQQQKTVTNSSGSSWWTYAKWLIAFLVVGALIAVIVYFMSKNSSGRETEELTRETTGGNISSLPPSLSSVKAATQDKNSKDTPFLGTSSDLPLGGQSSSPLSLSPDNTLLQLKEAQQHIADLEGQLQKARGLLEFWSKTAKTQELQIADLNRSVAQFKAAASSVASGVASAVSSQVVSEAASLVGQSLAGAGQSLLGLNQDEHKDTPMMP